MALTTNAARVDGGSIKLTEVHILPVLIGSSPQADAELGWTLLFVFSHCGSPRIDTAARRCNTTLDNVTHQTHS
jgi:hypothetical protein